MDRPLRIGELATRTGLNVQTIRWYERIGLLRPPQRGVNGYRLYGQEDVERLGLICQVKGLGLSLSNVQGTLELLSEGCCPEVRHEMARLLEVKIRATDARIAELQALRDQLQAHRSRILASSQGTDAEASCTPSSCVCLGENEPPQLLQIEGARHGSPSRS